MPPAAPPDALLEAIALHRKGDLKGAEILYNALLASQPDDATVLNLLGTLLYQWGNHENGLYLMDKAIAVKPDYATAYYDRGVALLNLARYHEALASFDKAILLAPDDAESPWNKSLIKLLLGEYEEGWALYEWRNKRQPNSRAFGKPLWLGKEQLAGKTILLHTEQGLGDAIQFCRYVSMVESLGAKVILEVATPLASLVVTLGGSVQVVKKGEVLPEFDCHCPLTSLPLALGTTIETIPARIPYLSVTEQKRKQWQQGRKNKKSIGLAWSGSATYHNDRNRSIALELMRPLFNGDYEFHVVQKDIRPGDQAILAGCRNITRHNLTDFADTAALISEMDVVLSVDTSAAHLAGALGKPVWVLLPFVPDFRWLLVREDSPWYPSARLFRQQRIGDWPGVIARVNKELEALYPPF